MDIIKEIDSDKLTNSVEKPSHRVGKLSRRKIVVSLALILIVGYLASASFYRQQSEQLPGNFLPISPINKSEYKSNTENIKFTLPNGWSRSNTSKSALPSDYINPKIVLQKSGTSCVITLAEKPDKSKLFDKQISFDTRIFSGYYQFDSNWYAPHSQSTADILFSHQGRMYLPEEYRATNLKDNKVFLLFNRDKKPVSDECNLDLNSLLRTVEPYYEPAQLTDLSKGTITSNYVMDVVSQYKVSKSYENLLFIDDKSGETREIIKSPMNTRISGYNVVGNKIYMLFHKYNYMGGENVIFDSSIYVVDPFKKEMTVIPGTEKNGSLISSLFIKDEVAYYLEGPSELATCLDRYKPCEANLYSIPLEGGNPTLVSKTTVGGSIVGYQEDENALYISQSWGDAGCATEVIKKIVGNKEELVGEFDGCVSAEEEANEIYDKYMAEADAIENRVRGNDVTSDAIKIENGKLTPSEAKDASYPEFRFIN